MWDDGHDQEQGTCKREDKGHGSDISDDDDYILCNHENIEFSKLVEGSSLGIVNRVSYGIICFLLLVLLILCLSNF